MYKRKNLTFTKSLGLGTQLLIARSFNDIGLGRCTALNAGIVRKQSRDKSLLTSFTFRWPQNRNTIEPTSEPQEPSAVLVATSQWMTKTEKNISGTVMDSACVRARARTSSLRTGS